MSLPGSRELTTQKVKIFNIALVTVFLHNHSVTAAQRWPTPCSLCSLLSCEILDTETHYHSFTVVREVITFMSSLHFYNSSSWRRSINNTKTLHIASKVYLETFIFISEEIFFSLRVVSYFHFITCYFFLPSFHAIATPAANTEARPVPNISCSLMLYDL